MYTNKPNVGFTKRKKTEGTLDNVHCSSTALYV